MNYQQSIISYICTADKPNQSVCDLYAPGNPGSVCRHYQWYSKECKANHIGVKGRYVESPARVCEIIKSSFFFKKFKRVSSVKFLPYMR